MTEEIEPPPPPEGYKEPESYEESKLTVKLKKYVPGFVLAVVIGLYLLLYADISGTMNNAIYSVNSELLGSALLILSAIFGFLIIAPHESLHQWGSKRKGYNSVRERWNMVIIREQFVERGDHIYFLLAPLVVLSSITLAGFLLQIHPLLDVFFGIAFWLNTAASGSDIYNSWYIYRKPRGTKFYTPSEGVITYVYKPENED